ncbi:hypothetical protein CBR_g54989 [Chara braunii]|uniref:Kazal-like domain-containing protein n=1 Tax=Chara braunii TaxID=69332 RepID=A0A388K7I1_CHABU|nr:hypothetical protein CBR_g54989 [Chara braunii]|eukprot:GBG66010.1 hypothetical protein CBR_g54989 [Chara braunii]
MVVTRRPCRVWDLGSGDVPHRWGSARVCKAAASYCDTEAVDARLRRRWDQNGAVGQRWDRSGAVGHGSVVISHSPRWQSVIGWGVLLSIVSSVLHVVFAGNSSSHVPHVGPAIKGFVIEQVALEKVTVEVAMVGSPAGSSRASSFVSLSTSPQLPSSSSSSSSCSSSSSSSSISFAATALQPSASSSTPCSPPSPSPHTIQEESSTLTSACIADGEKEDRAPCKVLCFAPTPVCGEDGITYWCGPKEAECAGVKVVHENVCALGNGLGTGSAFKAAQSLLIQSLLIVHFVWLVIVGLLVLAGRT